MLPWNIFFVAIELPTSAVHSLVIVASAGVNDATSKGYQWPCVDAHTSTMVDEKQVHVNYNGHIPSNRYQTTSLLLPIYFNHLPELVLLPRPRVLSAANHMFRASACVVL